MIVPVDESNLPQAGFVHAVSWQDSHRSFCAPDFIAKHTPERQEAYLRGKIARGTRVFLLSGEGPVGIVSVTGSLIEDLYVLPARQGRGYGKQLLRFAMAQCEGTPVLWILENNRRAERLYTGAGFCPTGRRNVLAEDLAEIEMRLEGPEGGTGSPQR